MKTSLKIAVVMAGLLLSACASTQHAAYRDKPPATQGPVVDERYVALVESVAKQRGLKVMWVNAPKKRVAGTVAARD